MHILSRVQLETPLKQISEMSNDSSSSSSGEEDGNAEWRAAIDSVATGSANYFPPRKEASQHEEKSKNSKPTHYQLKAQQILNDILEKTIEVVSSTNHLSHEDSAIEDSGIRLFRNAPCGIAFDHLDDIQRPHKRPRILPTEEIDEKSKAFKRQVFSAAVDGADIVAAAREASQKSLAKLEAREAAAKLAAKKEEERVAELKKIRGERWLPCMAKDRQLKLAREAAAKLAAKKEEERVAELKKTRGERWLPCMAKDRQLKLQQGR